MSSTKKEIMETGGELVIDAYETKNNFVVLSTVAGVSNKNIDISVDKDMLIIKGKRENPVNGEEKSYFYQECHWGIFSRKVILPENIDSSKIEASIEKGILKITFPKIQKKEVNKKINI